MHSISQFPITFSLISSDFQKQNNPVKSVFLLYLKTLKLRVTNLKSSNLKSRLLSPNYIFSLLITALHSSQQVIHRAGNLTGLSTDLPSDGIITLDSWQFCLVNQASRPAPSPDSMRYRQAQSSTPHWMSIRCVTQVMAALRVSGLTLKAALGLSNAHQWI